MIWSRIWRAPEPNMLAAAAAGEMLLARFRIAVLVIIPLVPTYKAITGSDFSPAVLFSYIAMLMAVAMFLYLKRFGYRPAFGFTAVFIDLALVSLGLLADVLVRETPLAGVNNKGTFDLYFLVILAASLRYDRRICLFAGAVALASYGGFVIHAVTTPNIDQAAGQWLERYGMFYMPDQISRLLFLAMGTGLSYLLVTRGSHLLELAVHDPLTGLYNRTFLREHLQMSIERARREEQPLAVALLDIDDFQDIGDLHGRSAGDAALRAFASFLDRRLREEDLVCRYGGEAFCVVFSDHDRQEAHEVLDRLAEEIRTFSFELTSAARSLRIRFSGGVAELDVDGEDRYALIDTADHRLLQARSEGGDRTISE